MAFQASANRMSKTYFDLPKWLSSSFYSPTPIFSCNAAATLVLPLG